MPTEEERDYKTFALLSKSSETTQKRCQKAPSIGPTHQKAKQQNFYPKT